MKLYAAVSSFFWVSVFFWKKETSYFRSHREEANYFSELQQQQHVMYKVFVRFFSANMALMPVSNTCNCNLIFRQIWPIKFWLTPCVIWDRVLCYCQKLNYMKLLKHDCNCYHGNFDFEFLLTLSKMGLFGASHKYGESPPP